MAKRTSSSNTARLLRRIDEKLTQVLAVISGKPAGVVELGIRGRWSLTVEELLGLPYHLRQTVLVLDRLGRATAEMISAETKRARALESSYLNRLVKMEIMRKERQGREIYFYISKRKPRKLRQRA